ncbi:hypothetical protein GY12_15810 [Micrococcus luteus]|nr:hypothetical protein GY12_15810 [Micrococcus luteus]
MSTIGRSGVSRPIWVRAHVQASGFTASPTVPIRRIEDRSGPPSACAGIPSGCQPLSERIRVGAV